jgi:transcriptional regulator with XRE-family HTH domain
MKPSDASLTFGREVRRRRNALGLTLPEFAARAGLTPNFVGGVELGRREPSLGTAVKLAAGFDAPLGELLGAPGLRPDAVEAARLLSKLPRDVRETITEALRSLVIWGERGKP